MLAAIGGHYGWPRRDLEALDDRAAQFWHNAAARLHEANAKARE